MILECHSLNLIHITWQQFSTLLLKHVFFFFFLHVVYTELISCYSFPSIASVWWWSWLSCLCADVHDTMTVEHSRNQRTAVVNYYYYHQPGPCVANKWHAIFAMIKSAGDSEEMSGFKNPFSGYIQYMWWLCTALLAGGEPCKSQKNTKRKKQLRHSHLHQNLK